KSRNVCNTGGSRGIGAGIVRQAMEEGAQVAFTYRGSADTAAALSRELEATYPGQACLGFQCDVTDTKAMDAFAQQVLAQFGRVDALVNNAGITQDAVLARMTPEQWHAVISTNLDSMYNATKPL